MLSAVIESLILFWLTGWSVLWLAGAVSKRPAGIRPAYSGSFALSVKLALPVSAGMLLRYATELLTGNSQIAEALCLIIGVCAVPVLARKLMEKFQKFKSQPALLLAGLKLAAIFILIWAPLAAFSILDPIIVGDAKEIWFFHAKMIFYAQGINQQAGFADPAVLFSHPDYPKILPAIGSAVARINGAWNDHLPKFSVALMLLPAFAFIADLLFQRRYLFGLVYLGLVISGGGSLLYSGYVDPILSANAGLIALALFFAVEDGDDLLIGLAVITAGLTLNLKSEGLPLVFFTLPPLLWAAYGKVKRDREWQVIAVASIILAFVCYASWAVISSRLGLVNDMSGDKGAAWARFLSRVGDPVQWRICLGYFAQHLGNGYILTGILAATIFRYKTMPKESRFKMALAANLGALSYSAFMFLVYLSTHHDLTWHLHYSSYRTLLPAQTLIGISILLTVPLVRGGRLA
jgi:hypothetical protein